MVARTRIGIAVSKVVAVGAAIALGCFWTPRAAAEVPAGTTYSEAYFSSADGTVLHADVLRPAGLTAPRTPVLLAVTPYNAHGHDPTGSAVKPPPPQSPTLPYALTIAERINAFRRGYSLVVVDARGFGASGGCWDNGGPGEQADVAASVRWAATQPWSSGKVAVIGMSYEGTTAVEALATHPPGLAAVVALSPVVSAYLDSYTNGVPRWYDAVNAPYYNGTHYFSPSLYDNPDYDEHWAVAKSANCVGSQTGSTISSNPNLPYWRERDLIARASESNIPVFGSQGFLDTNVAPDNLPLLYPQLRNPHSLWLGQYAHYSPVTDNEVGRSAAAQLTRFLDLMLLGKRPARNDPSVVIQEAPDLRWRAETRWPPSDTHYYPIAIRAGQYLDAANNASGDDVLVPPAPPIPAQDYPMTGQGAWTFTQPLSYEIHLAGTPRLRVQAVGPSNAHLVALLYDISANGKAFLICRGATLLGTGKVDLTLYPQDWRLAPGHRLGVLISGADVSEWIPQPGTETTVRVLSGTLAIPALRYIRTRFLDGGTGTSWATIKHPIQLDQTTISSSTNQTQFPPPLTTSPGTRSFRCRPGSYAARCRGCRRHHRPCRRPARSGMPRHGVAFTG